MNDEPFSKQNNFFDAGNQNEEIDDQNLNDVQQFDDFNENLNEVVNSDQNLDRRAQNGGFLSVDEENEDTHIKSSFKSENEQLNKKTESNHNANFSSQKMEEDED